MTKPEKNQGKPETRKRKLADSDEESGEEEAAQKTASKKTKTPKKCQSESNVAEDSDDFLIANYARLGLKDRRGKPEKRKLKLPNADEELEEEADAEMKTITNHSKSDKEDYREEEEAMSDKRKTDNEEGPAAKKLKKPEGMRGKSNVLFVRNLSFDTDEYSLLAAFDGAVSARIPTFQHTGKSRGFGYVDFSSAEAAADAFDSMNGQPVDGRKVTLDFDVGGCGFGVGGDRRRPRGGFNKVRYSTVRNKSLRKGRPLMIVIKHH